MLIVGIIIFSIIAIASLFILLTKIYFHVSYSSGKMIFNVTILSTGFEFIIPENKLTFVLGNYKKSFDTKTSKKQKPAKKSKKKREKKEKKSLSWQVWAKIIKAGLLFIGRFLSKVEYESAQLDIQPVFANPALAGMAYGWSSAFMGAIPGLSETINFTPRFDTEKSQLSGELTLSIKNRSIIYLLYRLFRDLPIKELVKHSIGR